MTARYKVSELEGGLLDAAVAKAQGRVFLFDADHDQCCIEALASVGNGCPELPFRPSRDWAIGGPIIERERVQLEPLVASHGGWHAYPDADARSRCSEGPTALIAAMRAYVAVKLGEEVDL